MSPNPPAEARSVSDSKALAEAERSGRPFLVFRDGDGRQHLFFFEPGSASASVGRRPSSDLVLGWDDQVSRLHARFERSRDSWILVDDGLSSNGTFVNEERLNGRRRLFNGDTVRFGATRATFRTPERGPQAPAPPAAHPPQPQPSPVAPAVPQAEAARRRAAVGLSSTQRRVLASLCRPYKGRSGFANPASDEQIAEELFLSVGEVRGHIRVLHAKLGLGARPSAEARVRLVEHAFSTGLIAEGDL